MPSSLQTSRHVPDAAMGSRIKRGRKYSSKILDEVAAAIAGLAAVAVLAGTVEVVEAGEVRDGACISGCQWQPSIDGSVTLLCSRRDPFQAAGIEGISVSVAAFWGAIFAGQGEPAIGPRNQN